MGEDKKIHKLSGYIVDMWYPGSITTTYAGINTYKVKFDDRINIIDKHRTDIRPFFKTGDHVKVIGQNSMEGIFGKIHSVPHDTKKWKHWKVCFKNYNPQLRQIDTGNLELVQRRR